MFSRLCLLSTVAAMLAAGGANIDAGAPRVAVQVYLTTADQSDRLTRQPDLAFSATTRDTPMTIHVDDAMRYQPIDGFGGAMTDTSAWLLYTGLAPGARETALRRLFDPAHGIGMSFMRVPIGASDFTRDGVPYSYDDLPAGQTDPNLGHFSIAHDLAYIIPVLKEALRINPRLRLVASPWSPPDWMKTAPTAGLSGALAPSAYAAFARYIVKFIEAYQAQGIPIYAVTPQNEPGHAAGYPGMTFPAQDESAFIAAYLGPALAHAGLHTRILAYDSYWNTAYTTPDYPFLVMRDAAAARYVAGTAWHCYEGSPDVMTRMHEAYPAKDNYETECSSGIAHGDTVELIIASTRNWARGVLLWNVALDTHGGPKEGNGCPHCIAPLTLDLHDGRVSYTGDYYELGQAGAFVHPGAYRIGSTSPTTRHKGSGLGCANFTSYGTHTVDDVAFQNRDGSIVLLAYNAATPAKRFTVRWSRLVFRYTLPACAAVTFTWAG